MNYQVTSVWFLFSLTLSNSTLFRWNWKNAVPAVCWKYFYNIKFRHLSLQSRLPCKKVGVGYRRQQCWQMNTWHMGVDDPWYVWSLQWDIRTVINSCTTLKYRRSTQTQSSAFAMMPIYSGTHNLYDYNTSTHTVRLQTLCCYRWKKWRQWTSDERYQAWSAWVWTQYEPLDLEAVM